MKKKTEAITMRVLKHDLHFMRKLISAIPAPKTYVPDIKGNSLPTIASKNFIFR